MNTRYAVAVSGSHCRRPTTVLTEQSIADRAYRRELAIAAASIGDTEGVLLSRYEPPANACVCTDLSVTVLCEDCDTEADPYNCFVHDRTCQDAAQAGGIREHTQFFCTTSN